MSQTMPLISFSFVRDSSSENEKDRRVFWVSFEKVEEEGVVDFF